MKRTLFISYSHDDLDRGKLNYLIEQIEKASRGSIRVLIDLKEVELGGSFTDYMALLDSYSIDAVLVVLTPSYKQKVLNNAPGGVPPEFRAIYYRYLADKEDFLSQPKSDLSLYEGARRFGLLPVILSGSPESAVPEQFLEESLCYSDIARVVVHKVRDNKLKDDVLVAVGDGAKDMARLAENVVSALKNIAKSKDKDYQQKRAEIRRALFANTKAGIHRVLETEVFVKTHTYQRVLNQETQFVVGRKGSGKSTLTQQLELQDPQRYRNHISIDFSRISLSFIYSYYTNEQFQSDNELTKNYRAEYLESVWQCFLLVCFIWNKQSEPVFEQWINQVFEHDINDYTPQEFFNTALNFSIEKFQSFQEQVIGATRHSFATLPARLSARRFIHFAIGEDLLNKIAALVDMGATLMTLDGIDSAFHDYRMEYMRYGDVDSSEYYQKRSRVELDLIKSLIRLILDIKAKSEDYPILSSCDFCITIPLDLYQEIKYHHERDSYQLLLSCRALDWSGPELALMLRKRLEKLTNTIIDRDKYYQPKERLLALLEDSYDGLPKSIPVTNGTRTNNFPIFVYVLRHTFWRPREIIFHFVGLLSSFEYYKKNIPITVEDVKAIVKEQTKALIASEFIDEFKSTISNIEDVLEHFRTGPQCYELAAFEEKLKTVHFDFYMNPHALGLTDTDNKLRLLYEIGFIGLQLSKPQMEKHARPRSLFSFCEGVMVFDELAREGYKGVSICIHPAFIEYLSIDLINNQEIVLDIDWEYLRENEIRRNAALQW